MKNVSNTGSFKQTYRLINFSLFYVWVVEAEMKSKASQDIGLQAHEDLLYSLL